MMRLLGITASVLISSAGFHGLSAQTPATPPPVPMDSGSMITIIRADRLTLVKVDSATERFILGGHVELQQGNTRFYCDSAVKDEASNTLEAFGNIHINDSDSVHTYAQYLKYLGYSRIASLQRKVTLTDGVGVLTTDELLYDLNTRIGSYSKGGRVKNGASVLNSREGYYFADTRQVYFKQQVKLVDPEYTLSSDSLLYDLDTELATFIAPTTINDGTSTIKTRSGFYNLKTGEASFGRRPYMEDSTTQVEADSIRYDKKSGMGVANGNVVVRDTAQGITILSGASEFNNQTKEVLATRKPVMILRQDGDSVFIAADTLFSREFKDTAAMAATDTADSAGTAKQVRLPTADTIRQFHAYRHVRIFNDSLQAVCDSLSYSSVDSVFRLFQSPIIWTRDSQVSGDTVYLFTRNRKPDRLHVIENGFSVMTGSDSLYNQVSGRVLTCNFTDGTIDNLRAKGNAESLYYLQDDDSAYFGLNYAKADVIQLHFVERELKKVIWINGVEGTTYPFGQIPADRRKLQGFSWQEERRPKSRYTLFAD